MAPAVFGIGLLVGLSVETVGMAVGRAVVEVLEIQVFTVRFVGGEADEPVSVVFEALSGHDVEASRGGGAAIQRNAGAIDITAFKHDGIGGAEQGIGAVDCRGRAGNKFKAFDPVDFDG